MDRSRLKAALGKEKTTIGANIFYHPSKSEHPFLRNSPFPQLALDKPALIHACDAHASRHVYLVLSPCTSNCLVDPHVKAHL